MRLSKTLLLAVFAAMTTLAQVAAQQPSALPPPDLGPATQLTAQQRNTIALDLISKWQSDVRKRPAGDVPRWSIKLKASIAQADAANVLRASTMTSLETMHAALNGQIQDGAVQSSRAIGNAAVAPQSLGSLLSDTTYTPLPNGRCRVADSRTINSPLAAGSSRALIVDEVASYASQGGDGTYANGTGSTNCGIPANAAAYAISVTLLSPTANGVFKVYRTGDAYQAGNSVLFNAGDYGANGDLIVRSCQVCASEISIQSTGTVHYVIDIVGYFHAPEATALACINTTYNTFTINPNTTGSWSAPACTTGYTSTSTTCFASNAELEIFGQGRGFCYAQHQGTNSVQLSASQVCCKVPGR